MRVRYDIGKVREAFEGWVEPVERAATEAIDQAGSDIKSEGRANIAAAGFGRRWQNALRVDRYPKRGISSSAALWVYHKIPYAEAFESGAIVRGTPLLWIPFSSAPKRLGKLRMTPKNYIATVGPLVSVNIPGKPPMLFGKYAGRGGKTSLAGLRRGASQGGRMVPLFFGVTSVTIRKRFNLRAIFKSAAAKLPQYYGSYFTRNK